MKRRQFLRNATTALAAASLPACSKSRKTLNVFTWADYLHPDLALRFEKENDCRLVLDTFDSNETMYSKLKAGATGYQLLVPSSYMVKVLRREGMIQPLDHAALPNIKHVDAGYLTSALDPKMEVSVPYMLAATGLGYLQSKVANVAPTWHLLERPELKGRITLLNDMREVLGAALKLLGHSLNSVNPAELAAATEVVLRWKANIAKFENDQYRSGLASGEFHLVHGYAGDISQVMEENDDIAFLVPEEGAAFSCDDLCIPISAKETDLAYTFINFLTDPAVAAENMEWIGYRAPNLEAETLVSEEFHANAALFPDAATFAKWEALDDLGDDLRLYSEAWDQVKAG
jgi:spermidine/putrescine transport system substrate-binding protein